MRLIEELRGKFMKKPLVFSVFVYQLDAFCLQILQVLTSILDILVDWYIRKRAIKSLFLRSQSVLRPFKTPLPNNIFSQIDWKRF